MNVLDPTVFTKDKRFYRYIVGIYRKPRKGISPGAFKLSEEDETNKDPHLSVNLLDKDSTNEDTKHIISYYKKSIQKNDDTIAYVDHKVDHYIDCSNKSESKLSFNMSSRYYEFNENGTNKPAFKHRPTNISRSHSGVEFLRAMNQVKQNRFSQEMVKKRKRYHES